MNKKCLGCGLILQTKDKSLPGFTSDIKKDYCRRCFRLKHYGEKKNEHIDELKVLAQVNKSNALAFFLVDFLNINAKTLHIFNQITIPKVLVISKSDILRKEMKLKKIENWLKHVYKIKDKIIFISSKSSYKSASIFKVMAAYQLKTAYIMGITNAGKSTYINKLLKANGKEALIVASNKPNTTLDFIKLRIGDYTIIDTPGFSYEFCDLALSNKEIKPLTYQIKAGTKIIINHYEFLFLEPNNITFYGNIPIKREFSSAKKPIYKLKVAENHDLVMPGLGFLNIKKDATILSNVEKLETRIDVSEDYYE